MGAAPADRRRPAGAVRGSRRGWLMAGAVCALAFVGLYVWTVRTEAGQWLDIRLFSKAQTSNDLVVDAAGLARRGLPLILAAAYVVVAGVALLRGHLRLLVVTAMMVLLSAGLARGLRDVVLDRPYLGDHGYLENTFPAGHVTVAVALAVALAMLVPVHRRSLARVMAGVVVLVVVVASMASVIGHAHRPSDVLGAVLLAGAVAGAAMATMRPARVRGMS